VPPAARATKIVSAVHNETADGVEGEDRFINVVLLY
jgi:hypothetical protein